MPTLNTTLQLNNSQWRSTTLDLEARLDDALRRYEAAAEERTLAESRAAAIEQAGQRAPFTFSPLAALLAFSYIPGFALPFHWICFFCLG